MDEEKRVPGNKGRKLYYCCTECDTIFSNVNLKKKPEELPLLQKHFMCKCSSKKKWYRMYV
jgi:hypothetical protein